MEKEGSEVFAIEALLYKNDWGDIRREWLSRKDDPLFESKTEGFFDALYRYNVNT